MSKDAKSHAAGQAGQEAAPKKVAIACQGGGIHAAFAVGVLGEILKDLEQQRRFQLIGISGTSAGALCALMVWYGLAQKNGRVGSPREARECLRSFWESFAAIGLAERLLNFAAYSAFKMREIETPILGLTLPVVKMNPRGVISHAVMAALPFLGVRQEYFDLADLLDQACPEFESVEWDALDTRLLIGATDVLNGIETVFDSQCNMSDPIQNARLGPIRLPERIWRERRKLCMKGVAASGTLPELREAEQIGDRCYWDGLYSLNPPIREFWEGVSKEYMPNEIWVIRINPQQTRREPRSHAEIEDRQNELMGNLALNKELDFIAHMNLLRWYEVGQIRINPDYPDFLTRHYEEVTIRTIKMHPDTCAKLRYSTKFNRSRGLIETLRAEGRIVARDWLKRWPSDLECDRYPQDVGHWPVGEGP